MATIQNKSTVQNTQDFITIQDLFYLCLNKWHWFAISLALCLGVATFYLLRTPSVYVRTASILIKDDSKREIFFYGYGVFFRFGTVYDQHQCL